MSEGQGKLWWTLLSSLKLAKSEQMSRSRQLISKVEAMLARVRHAGAKMEAPLVGNFMEKRVVFRLRPWSMIFRKRGCFQETTFMDLKIRGCFLDDNHHSLEKSSYAPMIVIHSLNFVLFIKYNSLLNLLPPA